MPINVDNPFKDTQPYFRHKQEVIAQGTCDNCSLPVEAMVYIRLFGHESPEQTDATYVIEPEHVGEGPFCDNAQATLNLLTTLA